MSKSTYLSILLGHFANLRFNLIWRHFKVAINKHAHTFGLFENWHPIPRIVCGYFCGFILLIICFLLILPAAAILSFVEKKLTQKKTIKDF